MTIQVDFSGRDQSIDVYEGDSLENLACKILVKNNLPSSYLESVERMLFLEVQKNEKVSVHNGFLYQLVWCSFDWIDSPSKNLGQEIDVELSIILIEII